MKIETYSIVWNEEDKLPWYLEHYSFADKHFLFNDISSDDKTKEIILSSSKCSLINVDFGLNNQEFRDLKDKCWKDSDADWVIVGDIDEFLFHPNMVQLLSTTSADILQPSIAYNMVCDPFTNNWKEIKNGVIIGNENPGEVKIMADNFVDNVLIIGLGHDLTKWLKCMLFRPSKVDTMQWNLGCHFCKPLGKNGHELSIQRILNLNFLHYHYIGVEKVLEKHKKYVVRAAANNEDYAEYHLSRNDILAYIQSGNPIDFLS